MRVDIQPGIYVVAVSGGVDSITLLNMLSMLAKSAESRGESSTTTHNSALTPHPWHLIVAHYDHGIRSDSSLDRELVQLTAETYGLPFVFDEGNLGPKVSEAVARAARYKFLQKVVKTSGAQAIITAHHQDDLLETAIINMLRGTGRRGLSSLKDQPELLRPFLKFNKTEIIDYAKVHKLKWREDSTNQDTSYLRNYVRHKIIPKLSKQQKQALLEHIDKLGELNPQIDAIIEQLVSRETELDRDWFIGLDHSVARDVMAGWLRGQGIAEIDSKRLELLVRAAKTYKPNKRINIDKNHVIEVGKNKLAFM